MDLKIRSSIYTVAEVFTDYEFYCNFMRFKKFHEILSGEETCLQPALDFCTSVCLEGFVPFIDGFVPFIVLYLIYM